MNKPIPTLSGGMNKPILITGGAGFVGTNLAHALLSEGHRVVLYDNLSRAGVEENWDWLREAHGEQVRLAQEDVRDPDALRHAAQGAGQVFHFAAQVAVTSSLVNPLHDFEVNARGTLNLLEALRGMPDPPPTVFTSTNKVYGGLEDVPLRCRAERYEPADAKLRAQGISETRPLDFHSPYGCSKGAADQYVIDYARTYGLPAVVFRMSCIYGPHQFGTEDQGWVAHFVISALEGKAVTLYGDGMQVRDVLYAGDLVHALRLAQAQIGRLSGQAYNIGGGAANTLSLRGLLAMLEELHGAAPPVTTEDWRPGDQRYYVSDTRKFENATGWRAHVSVADGIARLSRWLCEARGLHPHLLGDAVPA